ncbi:MAG: undecaprenyldiphospho-muramoylpentapeptide beta-N-acetylglucosaminyltransferase [Firmicutes bacterium]|nr:undecaprenyldiphospho-muramoylpentapeptide beta-N-acetylglucosaminyltransferase [Bacillota bacterium]
MKCIFGCGGTGGHLYPALAIAEKIKKEEPNSEIIFMGSKKGLEAEVVPAEGYKFVSIPAQGMDETDTLIQRAVLNVNVGLSNLAGVTKALAVIRSFKPDAIIGTGGYVSFPVLFAGELLKVPCYIHEQNAVVGRANQALAKNAKKLFVAFKGMEDSFGYPEKTIFTGNPVRAEFSNLSKVEARENLGISMNDFVVFAFGGSLGAATINNIAIDYLERSKNKPDRTLLFGTGRRFYEECITRIKDLGLPTEGRVRVEGYINNMKDYVGAADLLICRAGALTLTELLVAGRPAVIVPIPHSVGNHQYYNAKAIADAGGAFMVEENNFNLDDISEKIEYLAKSRMALERMGEVCKAMAPLDAVEKIYREIKS